MDENNSQSRVLITGATGFIGSALASYFYSQGFYVRALTRSLSHPDVVKNPQYEWVAGDLTKIDSINNSCNNIDFVFHAAGFAHASKKQDPDFQKKHHLLNYQATMNIANTAINVDVKRFIFFSTVKAAKDSTYCIDESWQEYPEDAYGLTKRCAEDNLLKISAETKMDVVILRLSLVYGVGWKGNLASMLKAIDKNWFPPIPKLDNQRSMISLQDVCIAAKKIAFAKLSAQRVFILTDGRDYSTDVLYHMMRAALGKQKPKWVIPLWLWRWCGKMGDVIQKTITYELPINSEAIEKLFGNAKYHSLYISEIEFVPQYSFEKVLPDIVAVYRSSLA